MADNQILKWPPLSKEFEKHGDAKSDVFLLIAPFVKFDALRKFLDNFSKNENLKLIVRWSSNDIISEVSDLAIYPFLKENNIPLYINNNIHLKLFILNANIAFHTSANITSKGLGYLENSNIEVGCYVNLTISDWENIYRLIDESQLVDDGIFKIYTEYFEKNKDNKKKPLPKLILPASAKKDYSINSLPASETPDDLLKYYSNPKSMQDEEVAKKAIHDIVLYQIPRGLSNDNFYKHLKTCFKASKFVNRVAMFIKEQNSCRFGAVNNWIHANCSDVPLPYRWEIKKNTHALYNWLAYFYDEISWNVPGKRSQVIYWHSTK